MELIKYCVVTITHIPSKSVVMDVVVEIPPKFGMLLSRY
jgi:hypothetical protein